MTSDALSLFPCINSPVLILDGNSERVAYARRKTGLFGEKKIRFVTAFDQILRSLRAHLFLSYHLM